MRVLVCGSRDFTDYSLMVKTLDEVFPCKGFLDYSIIAGGARGADSLAEFYASEEDIPCQIFPADWVRYGKRAGYVRNRQMLEEGKPDLVIAFWNGKSPGTQMMLNLAQSEDIKTIVVEY